MIHRRALLAGLGAACAAPAFAQAPAIAPYVALALQVDCDAVNQDSSRRAARARMMRAIERIGARMKASIGYLRGFTGAEVKLVVLPEYVLTGFPLGENRAQWREKAAIDPDGPEQNALAKLAAESKTYLAINSYETDPKFPALYFQTTVIHAPSGETALRYRRMISLYAPTPFDVWDEFLSAYGYDAAFPVADTEIGVLAAIASEEVLYPEIARMCAMKGAEIFVHPTSEIGSPDLTPKDISKRARALENMAYLISANTSAIIGTPIPSASTDAMSKIVDPGGKVLSVAGGGESMVAHAMIDIAALRAARRRAGMGNVISRQPWRAYAPAYETAPGAEPGGLPADRAGAAARQRETIQRLIKAGVVR